MPSLASAYPQSSRLLLGTEMPPLPLTAVSRKLSRMLFSWYSDIPVTVTL